MPKPIISADSHVTEPPGTYVDRTDRQFKARAPRMVRDAKRGDLFVIDGLDKPIPMGLSAAAGKSAEQLAMFGAKFEDMHRGGVGMMLCNHPDYDYKQACFTEEERDLVLHDNVAELYRLDGR